MPFDSSRDEPSTSYALLVHDTLINIVFMIHVGLKSTLLAAVDVCAKQRLGHYAVQAVTSCYNLNKSN